MPLSKKIAEQYITHILEHGKQPESVYMFCKTLKIKETDFYDEYNSFKQVEAQIWRDLLDESIKTAQKEDIYASYSAREKLLSVYFTHVEMLKSRRSYLLKVWDKMEKPLTLRKNAQLTEAQHLFYDFANELLIEAQGSKEIESRQIPFIVQRYPEFFWKKYLFVIEFWMNDDSRHFEKTDTIIEKVVNTTFDWLGHSPIDSLIDLGKFLYQNKKM
jgi:hypothetical protein